MFVLFALILRFAMSGVESDSDDQSTFITLKSFMDESEVKDSGDSASIIGSPKHDLLEVVQNTEENSVKGDNLSPYTSGGRHFSR